MAGEREENEQTKTRVYSIKGVNIVIKMSSLMLETLSLTESNGNTTAKEVSLRPPSFLFIPHGHCKWTGVKYGSREYAMGRNWDCVARGTYGVDTFCPCYDCWGGYVHRFIKLQSVCRMLMARNTYLTATTRRGRTRQSTVRSQAAKV